MESATGVKMNNSKHPLTDFHMHSTFSPDGQCSMFEMCTGAVALGYTAVSFTDHLEWNPKWATTPNYVAYFNELAQMRQTFAPQGLHIYSGVELGNPHHYLDEVDELYATHEFDVRVASLHWLYDDNIHNVSCFKNRNPQQVYYDYFLELIHLACDVPADILAHFDRIFWRGYQLGYYFDEKVAGSIVREALTAVIENNLALEFNTRLIAGDAQWHDLILMLFSWYKEAGGNHIIINADAHNINQISINRNLAQDILRQVGLEAKGDFRVKEIV